MALPKPKNIKCAVFFAGDPALCLRTLNLDLLIVSLVSGSPICHCAMSYDGVVIEVNKTTGVRYVPVGEYIDHHQCLQAVVQVPCLYEIDPDYWQLFVGKPVPKLPALLHWLDFGRGALPYECLSLTTLSLRAIGVPTPNGLTTPCSLFRWFKSGGYPFARRADAGFRDTAKRFADPDTGMATECL